MTRVFLAVTIATMVVGVLVLLIAQRRYRRAQVAAAPPPPPPEEPPARPPTHAPATPTGPLAHEQEELRRRLQERFEQFGVRFNGLHQHVLGARRRSRSLLGAVSEDPSLVVGRTAWSFQVTTMPPVDGVERVLRCTMHEDCRQDANIGIACARDRMDRDQ